MPPPAADDTASAAEASKLPVDEVASTELPVFRTQVRGLQNLGNTCYFVRIAVVVLCGCLATTAFLATRAEFDAAVPRVAEHGAP